jgi:hypothetical protein
MRYGLLVYQENKKDFNIGDYIQSLAAKQYISRIDAFINREKMCDYKGDCTTLIMNGWFTHNIDNWVPSDDIQPLFVSFHVNSSAAAYILNEKAIAYLKRHEPIGCRDQYTVRLLEEKGVKSYFSGCLTLTLDSYKINEIQRGDEIYIVDPLWNYPRGCALFSDYNCFITGLMNGDIFRIGRRKRHLYSILDNDLIKNSCFETHVLPANKYSHEEKFNIAENLLNKYARARLVITSRIHCALPCLALGTPVIFINAFDKSQDTCRFDGILSLFKRIDIDYRTGIFSANFILNETGKVDERVSIVNPREYAGLAINMKNTCNEFFKRY